MAKQDTFQPVVNLWLEKISGAERYKEDVFGKTATECLRFYDGPHDFMYKGSGSHRSIGLYVDGAKEIKTTFRVTTNKCAEVVSRFGPALYFNNPHRTVMPYQARISPQVFQMLGNLYAAQLAMQQRSIVEQRNLTAAELQQWFLNFTPEELDLKLHCRRAIDECLLTGMGCLWTEVVYSGVSRSKLIGSFHDSWENLIIDPDSDTLESAGYIIKRCCHPVYQVEREYGLEHGSVRGNVQSMHQAAFNRTIQTSRDEKRIGQTTDMLEYFKVYSRIGMGQHLSGADPKLREILGGFGDYAYLVVAPGVPYLLNLPPHIYDPDAIDENPSIEDEIKTRLRWPIPFWSDNAWPVSVLGFHRIPRIPYPMAHMKPALGELRFINWVMSFLADKVYLTSRDIIAIVEHADEDLETKIKSGDDLIVVKFKQSINRSINEMIQFVQHPSMNTDILKVLDLAIAMFDKATGLTDLMYGHTAAQLRSAEEAAVKKEFATVVLDDMAEQTQQWQKQIARKEALAARWNMSPIDVAPLFQEAIQLQHPGMVMPGMMPQPVLGPLTQLWNELVFAPPDYTNPESLYRTVREFEYTIEAESIRKPNREREIVNTDQAMQTMFQPFMQFYMQTGNPGPVNGLLQWWAKSRDIPPQLVTFPEIAQTPAIQQQPEAQDGQSNGAQEESPQIIQASSRFA